MCRSSMVDAPTESSTIRHSTPRRAAASRAVVKQLPRLAGVEDVGLERDAVLRRVDCGEHGWKGLVAIRVDDVACRRRVSGSPISVAR